MGKGAREDKEGDEHDQNILSTCLKNVVLKPTIYL